MQHLVEDQEQAQVCLFLLAVHIDDVRRRYFDDGGVVCCQEAGSTVHTVVSSFYHIDREGDL